MFCDCSCDLPHWKRSNDIIYTSLLRQQDAQHETTHFFRSLTFKFGCCKQKPLANYPTLITTISILRSIFEYVGRNGETKTLIKDLVSQIVGSGFEAKIKPEAYGASPGS